MEARAKLSYLADTPTFYDDLSVWEHLEYTARLHNLGTWEQKAADLLGQLGIYERADDLPTRFSRGLKQKAAIAIAFIRPFELMLVDEPFVGLDADGKEALLDLFEQASTDGAALVVATHELSFVARTARTIALRDGSLVFDGESSQAEARGLVAVEGTATQD
jgi:ABC-type multidrug transport system ATPase subunit